MNEARFFLNIPARDYLTYYQGRVRNVLVTAFDGRRIQFPAERLRPFVTATGVQGEFILHFDEQNRFAGLERVGELQP